jgi:hypothetical protein
LGEHIPEPLSIEAIVKLPSEEAAVFALECKRLAEATGEYIEVRKTEIQIYRKVAEDERNVKLKKVFMREQGVRNVAYRYEKRDGDLIDLNAQEERVEEAKMEIQ